MEERLPFVMAGKSADRGMEGEGRAQAGYFQREALWKHTLSMVGTKKDEFSRLISEAKKSSTEEALEKLLDFILQHDVCSEPWAEELLTSAFMSLAYALQNNRLKLKAYQALDSAATVLHGHNLCILLGETLMRDFAAGASIEVRLAALHGFLTLMANEHCSEVVLQALKDAEPKIRLRALQGITASRVTAPSVIYEAALQSLVSGDTPEASLAIQALSLLKPA